MVVLISICDETHLRPSLKWVSHGPHVSQMSFKVDGVNVVTILYLHRILVSTASFLNQVSNASLFRRLGKLH